MNKYQINIRKMSRLAFPFKYDWIRNIIGTVLRVENVKQRIEIGVVITDDSVIKRLNKRYRKIDAPTDVLSFSIYSDIAQSLKESMKHDENMRVQLGEIIISFPTATKQAGLHGSSVEKEVSLLLVHGTLHLLGHDHTLIAEARRMQSREKIIMGKLDLG
jgi:probable rRNA maturation factor